MSVIAKRMNLQGRSKADRACNWMNLTLGMGFMLAVCPVGSRAQRTPGVLPGLNSTALVGATGSADTLRTAAWLEAHRDSPILLRSFVQRMPKGGDIHNHLSGAIYAESYLAWAAAEDFCIQTKRGERRLVKCIKLMDSKAWEVDIGEFCRKSGASDSNIVCVADALDDARLYNRLVDWMSTRNLAFAGQSGHDQFFAAFSAFGPVSKLRIDEMVAEVASHAASERTFYLELMLTLQGRRVREVGKKINLDLGFAHARRGLLEDERFEQLISDGQSDLDTIEQGVRRTLRCGLDGEDPGCAVTVRYLQQTTRTKPPVEVFAQFVYAFELVRADSRVVGLNLVAPEDGRVALADYTLQMKMLEFLASQAPDVNIALHAGELTLGMVPPENLRFHIRQAVELGHARRIGHGVDLAYEDDVPGLLIQMRERNVLVEICLTSNDVILGVSGSEHPFRTYMQAGVPLTLATDDAGVSRIDLSNEYLRATLTYNLSYHDLKTLARNSLQHSFLPGESLWQNRGQFQIVDACAHDTPASNPRSPTCAQFLKSHERAREQWRLEFEFAVFEAGWPTSFDGL